MKTYLLKPGNRQAIAKAGETDVAVAYNAKEWMDDYPAGIPQLMVTRPDGVRVPVTVTVTDNLIAGQVPNELLVNPGNYSYVFVWTSGTTQMESGRCECIVLGSDLAKTWADVRRAPDWAERIFLAAGAIESAIPGIMEARNTAADKAAEATAAAEEATASKEAAADSAEAAAASEENIETMLSNMEQTVTEATAAMNGIEAQKNTMIASIAAIAEMGTDPTFTQEGVAADAKAVGDLKSNVDKIADIGYCQNLANPNTATDEFINSDGSIEPDNTWHLSDYIPIGLGYYTMKSITYYAYYDADKEFLIRAGTNTSGSKTIQNTTEERKYIRLCSDKEKNTWRFNAGETLVDVDWYADYVNLADDVGIPEQIDDTLTIQGKAADAKAVGDKISSIEQQSKFNHGPLLSNPADVSTRYTGYLSSADYAVEGLNRDTTYAQAIALFDALMSEAPNGYITKSDLGAASGQINGATPHIYRYTFKPTLLDVTGSVLKPIKILIQCGVHGFEKNSVYAWYFFLLDLVRNADKNPSLAFIRANVEIQIIPVLNPYGFENNTYNNGNGVNINRNYDTPNWVYVPSGSDASGDAPLDQPETVIAVNQVANNPDALICFDTHTNGQYYTRVYDNANANIIVYDTTDFYLCRMLDVFKKHVQNQTFYLPKEFPALNPAPNQLIGRDQSEDIQNLQSAGTFDTYCTVHASSIGMTLELFNGLTKKISEDEYETIITIFSGDSKKICSIIAGNLLLEIIGEYSR